MLVHFIFVMCGFEQKSFEFKFHLKNEFENGFGKIKKRRKPFFPPPPSPFGLQGPTSRSLFLFSWAKA